MRQDRRSFLKGALAGGVSLGFPGFLGSLANGQAAEDRAYAGPNVVIIRFGGGVRRQESIVADRTYSPYLLHKLIPRGTLFPAMEIAQIKDVNTSHGEGTLNILTGKYDQYKDVDGQFLGARFEAKVPTVFEYLRKAYAVPEHQTLIINHEDRKDEEFYSFSSHKEHGEAYRSSVLSLYRFKTYLLRRQIAGWKAGGGELSQKKKELEKLEAFDRRVRGRKGQAKEIEGYWERWRRYYGESGLVNPRGDRLLTELTLRALKELRPRLLIVNYSDADYVHWGNPTHYTRAIAIMDDGIKQIVAALEADEAYRGNTVLVVVPDCGRDDNRFAPVPFQHHFNTRSAHELFALFVGPGVKAGQVVDRVTQQVDVAPTIGRLMGFKAAHAEGRILEEVFA